MGRLLVSFLRAVLLVLGILPSTLLLPCLLLLAAASLGLSTGLGKGFFLLDLLLSLLVDVTLAAAFYVVSVVGVEEGSVAQGNVLAGPAVSDLLSVKVTTHTDGLVAV